MFEDEHRQYCLPVLDPQIITCHEEPFDQKHDQTFSSLVRYKQLNASEVNYTPDQVGHLVSLFELGTFKIVADYPSVDPLNIRYRTDDQAKGTMMMRMHPDPTYYNTSVS